MYPSVTRQLDFSTQLPAHTQPALKDSPEGEEKPILNVASGLNSKSLSRTFGQSLHSLESAANVVAHDPRPLCSSPGSRRVPAASPAAGLLLTGEGVEAFSLGTQSCGRSHLHRDDTPWHEDELIGLKTLSEIRKLLGETGTPPTNRQGSVATDFIPEKLGSNKDEAVTPAKEEEREFLSRWTVTSPQSNSLFGEGPRTGEDLGHRTPPTIGNTSRSARSLPGEGEWQWQEPLERQASTASGERATQPAFVPRADRAEPEGCSGATAGRPATAEFSRTTSKTINLTASKPLASPSAPQFASQPERAHALSANSSRDGDLDEDSSTDSLAVRVSNLLRDRSTATRESIPTRAADKVKHRTHDEEQMKLSMPPPDPLTILDEEDRRKIEEIKAELLQTSKNFIHPQISGAQSFTVPVTMSDSTSTQSPSAHPPHGPSSKLINKRCTRLVNQGVQTESPPIVASAKGRRTRDVGVTFPSPDSEPALRRPAVLGSHRQHSASPAGCSSARDKDRKRKGSSHTERAPGKDGRTSAGPAWFIPATELKWASRKENDPGPCHSCTSGNFELLPSTTLCREPLREKQLQQQWISNTARAWGQEPAQTDALLKNPSPLIRITLKEALHMNRPDFISHSRQRVRRLELLMEERKIQSILQSERERLFNQPQERGPRDRRGYQLAEAILFKRKIPKREMFDRSKRLYEQLPEVSRKREEDRRRAEYQTNRLKAQLYKQKITNRVLGKKVSWQ
ncbi:uncharacterized protein LOC144688510 [Cetorhinus maximus]